MRYLTGPWRLAVARVTATLEATTTSATGAPTAARLAATGGGDGGGRRRRRRRRGHDDGGGGDNQDTDQNFFLICGLLLVLRTFSHSPGRQACASADKTLLNAGQQDDHCQRQLCRQVEGGVRWRDDRHLLVALARYP